MTLSGQLAGLYEYRAALDSKIQELEARMKSLVGEPEEVPVPEEDPVVNPPAVAQPVIPAPVPEVVAFPPAPALPLTIGVAGGGDVYKITDDETSGAPAPAKRRGRPPGTKNKIH